MWVGIGVGIGRNRFATGIFNDYALRVNADGGITEAGQCVDAVTGILLNASLLLIPSGYKGGKLYAEIPTNGNGDLTWTRGSDAFRTNASGLIQRVPWNLLSYSEDFSNIYWSKDAGVTVDTNVDLAPNGTTTADRLNLSTNGAVYRSGLSFGTGSFTLSVWLKGEGANIGKQVLLEFTNGNSTVTLTGDWQRFTTTGTNVINVAIKRATSGQASAVLAWGIQVVEGTTAQTYLPTTDRLNFPRLSYMYGSCPSALLEPQRTNLVTWSQDFNDSSWAKLLATITANTTTSPDGTTNADTITDNTTVGLHQVQQTISTTVGTYTLSCYAKAGTLSYVGLYNNSANAGKFFNLSNGTTASNIVNAPTTATIQSVGNGWYRCTITINTLVASSNWQILVSEDGSTFNYIGTGKNAFIYGAQLEAGAYPTTYIPTTSATATRVADSFSRNNIYTNGLISASGGTWFVELRNNIGYTRDASGSFFIDSQNGGLGNGFNIRNVGTPNQRFVIVKYVSFSPSNLYFTLTDTVKIAIKWNGSTADVFVNGTKVVSGTSFTTTNMEFFGGNGNDQPKFIQQMALFPSPLSDTDCTTLTT